MIILHTKQGHSWAKQPVPFLKPFDAKTSASFVRREGERLLSEDVIATDLSNSQGRDGCHSRISSRCMQRLAYSTALTNGEEA